MTSGQGCQICRGTTNQIGKNIPKGTQKYQMAIKYTKIAVKILNGH
jgi:hypothetical protein